MVFGDRLDLADHFVAVLADTGVSHGLLGPREVPRLWSRHVLNCAVVADTFPLRAQVVDVGSGAGLPGLALAIARPDLDIVLVEPMLRRVTWLQDTVGVLGLSNVAVCRARAEDLSGHLLAPWVTARAVAPLARLARWCRPLLTAEGTLIALKGASAATELARDRAALESLGLVDARIVEHGRGVLDPPTVTVDLRFGPTPGTAPRRAGSAGRSPRRPG